MRSGVMRASLVSRSPCMQLLVQTSYALLVTGERQSVRYPVLPVQAIFDTWCYTHFCGYVTVTDHTVTLQG